MLPAASALAGDVPKAVALLEVTAPLLPGQVPEAAPVRFVLMETGQVFVGGTSEVAVGQLSSSEQKSLEKRLGDLRKLSGIARRGGAGIGRASFAPGRAPGAGRWT